MPKRSKTLQKTSVRFWVYKKDMPHVRRSAESQGYESVSHYFRGLAGIEQLPTRGRSAGAKVVWPEGVTPGVGVKGGKVQ